MKEDFLRVLKGSFPEMEEQKNFLVEQRFKVKMTKIGLFHHPALGTEQEYNEAIKLIWEYKVSGWFHYKLDLVKTGICTSEEFSQSLRKEWLSSVRMS